MDNVTRFAAAIRAKTGREATSRMTRRGAILYGKWVQAESVDSDLSQVYVAGGGLDGSGETLRFIPKLESVGTISADDTVLCVGSPLCIIGVVVGDITLANIDEG